NEVSKNKVKNHGPKIESSAALVHQPEAPVEPTPAPTSENTAAPEEAPVVEDKPVIKPKPELVRNFPTVNFYKVRGTLFTVNEPATEELAPALLPKEIKDA